MPVDVLVDTGSTYTVLPRALLEELGVESHRRGQFELADGTIVERDLGRVWVSFEETGSSTRWSSSGRTRYLVW